MTDPITAGEEARTPEGNLHGLGLTLGLAIPFAVALVGWRLARNQAWSAARRLLTLAFEEPVKEGRGAKISPHSFDR